MGPAPRNSRAGRPDPSHPPVLHAKTDKHEYRREVQTWTTHLRNAAGNKDKTAMTLRMELVNSLRSAMSPDIQEVVNSLHDEGIIDADQADPDLQEDYLRIILNKVAYDTPNEAVNRIAESFKKTHSCKRDDNESIASYVTRFRGRASRYLSLSRLSPRSRESQLLALVMIENAGLDATTQANVKLQLAAMAEQDKPSAEVNEAEEVNVCIAELEKVKHTAKKASELLEHLNANEDDDSSSSSSDDSSSEESKDDPAIKMNPTQHQTLKNYMKSILMSVDKEWQAAPEPSAAATESAFKQDDVVRFHLEHACSVLSSITAPIAPKPMSKHEVQRVVTSYLANNPPSKAASADNSRHGEKKYKSKAEKMREVKNRTSCKACGKRGHWATDPECGENSSGDKPRPQKKKKTDQGDRVEINEIDNEKEAIEQVFRE